MRTLFFSSISVLVLFWFSAIACTNNASGAAKADSGPKTCSDEPIPDDADTAQVAFRDLNYWTENGQFCIASLVDNQAAYWQRIWVRIEVLDANGEPLKIDGESSLVVRALADAIPPRGASAFFVALSRDRLSGEPASCRLSGAGSISQDPGAILIAGDIGGVRVQKPDPNDPTKILELAFQVSGKVENPLNVEATHPRLVFLLYGKDLKLYYVQMLNPEDPKPAVSFEPKGPVLPQGRAKLYCPIQYNQLPQKLQEVLIGRADIQVYDARE